jgi:hypothetical protein
MNEFAHLFRRQLFLPIFHAASLRRKFISVNSAFAVFASGMAILIEPVIIIFL